MTYITYLTIYNGDKLPPFYIGSTTMKRHKTGYRGSVGSKKYKSIWKSELKEHPELFDTIILTEHETHQEALKQELKYQIQKDIVKNPKFINMGFARIGGWSQAGNISNLGLKRTDEAKRKMRDAKLGTSWSEERRKKRSAAISGENHPFFGKHHTEEAKKKQGLPGDKHPYWGKFGEYHPAYGTRRDKETLKRLSLAHSGENHHFFGIKQELVKCPHCGKEGGHIAMKHWHFENCPQSPTYRGRCYYKKHDIIVCPHCGKEGGRAAMKRYHFENCPKSPMYKGKPTPKKLSTCICPHCGKEGAGGAMVQWHFENCKKGNDLNDD